MERPTEFKTLRIQWENKEISARDAAKRLGITHSTFLRWAKKVDEKVHIINRYYL